MFILDALRRLVGRPPAPHKHMNDAVFRSMVEQSSDIVCHVADGLFTYVSPSARAIFGWDPSKMVGTDGLQLLYPPDLPILQDVLARTAAGELGAIRHQVRVICGDGSLRWTETNAHNERSVRGGIQTVLIIRDISERKRKELELQELARKDGLTGLANRRLFDEFLDQAWRQTLREGSEMALLLIDVDHFKQFNDTHGHQAGDDCLRMVAAVVGDFARRPLDLACRYGGEEFALIMGGAGSNGAVGVAEEIRSAVFGLGIPHEVSLARSLTVSIGVATAMARVGGSVRMPETLLQAADHALYKAKAGGRNRVERSVVIAPSEKS